MDNHVVRLIRLSASIAKENKTQDVNFSIGSKLNKLQDKKGHRRLAQHVTQFRDTESELVKEMCFDDLVNKLVR